MTMPVMGDSTPRVKKKVEDAELVCPTDSHRYGYMISVAQGLEIELDKREKQLIECQQALINRNTEYMVLLAKQQSAALGGDEESK